MTKNKNRKRAAKKAAIANNVNYRVGLHDLARARLEESVVELSRAVSASEAAALGDDDFRSWGKDLARVMEADPHWPRNLNDLLSAEARELLRVLQSHRKRAVVFQWLYYLGTTPNENAFELWAELAESTRDEDDAVQTLSEKVHAIPMIRRGIAAASGQGIDVAAAARLGRLG